MCCNSAFKFRAVSTSRSSVVNQTVFSGNAHTPVYGKPACASKSALAVEGAQAPASLGVDAASAYQWNNGRQKLI